MPQIPVRTIKDSFFELGFSIRTIEPLVTDHALIHDLHRHDFYFILCIKHGKGVHEIDFIRYEVGDYSVFFIRPGQVHFLQLEQGTSGFMVQFTPEFYAPRENPAGLVLRKVSHKNLCQLSTERFDRIFTHLQSILGEYSQRQHHFKEVITAYLDILLIELVRQSPTPNKIVKPALAFHQERLEELQQLIERHSATKKQVQHYADMLSITSYQLNSITKALLQKTCSELINDYIILEAKRLLLATSNQINQIADMLGYDDPSYFIRFFKKHTGVSPEAFRKQSS